MNTDIQTNHIAKGRVQIEPDKVRPATQPKRRGNTAYILWMGSLFFAYIYTHAFEAWSHDWQIFKREWRVCVGSIFLIIGILGFESSKYCDGNTTDYISCTRPSTYYYYDAVDILLVIAGVLLIIFWSLQSVRRK